MADAALWPDLHPNFCTYYGVGTEPLPFVYVSSVTAVRAQRPAELLLQRPPPHMPKTFTICPFTEKVCGNLV